MDPQHTGKEFTFAIGKVAWIMDDDFECGVPCWYLGRVVAEAMAVKNPVLEGSWEIALWLLIYTNRYYSVGKCGVLSDHLSAWIIHTIGDSTICPNPWLRIEMMTLLLKMVDINASNQMQAMESILSACSYFSIEYMSVDLVTFYQTRAIKCVLSGRLLERIDLELYRIKLTDMAKILTMFKQVGHLPTFDFILSNKLLDVKVLRSSAILHDVGYIHANTSIGYTQPSELYGLIALFQNIAGTMQHLKQNVIYYVNTTVAGIRFPTDLKHISYVLYKLYIKFKASCQTPQLVHLASSCIMSLVELVITVNAQRIDSRVSLHTVLGILENLFDSDSDKGRIPTAVALYMSQQYQQRIDVIWDKCNVHFHIFRMIRSLLS